MKGKRMNDTTTFTGNPVPPADPVMAAGDPAMFASLTGEENLILGHHLTSGWYKQSAVYPTLSEPWRETHMLIGDLHQAWRTTQQAEHEPEAGQ
jgi:hypothetical protein